MVYKPPWCLQTPPYDGDFLNSALMEVIKKSAMWEPSSNSTQGEVIKFALLDAFQSLPSLVIDQKYALGDGFKSPPKLNGKGSKVIKRPPCLMKIAMSFLNSAQARWWRCFKSPPRWCLQTPPYGGDVIESLPYLVNTSKCGVKEPKTFILCKRHQWWQNEDWKSVNGEVNMMQYKRELMTKI